MPIYRRPIRISPSKLPIRLTGITNGSGATSTRVNRVLVASSQVPVLSSSQADAIVSLCLPVPPSINHQYATVNGRRLLSSTGRAYKSQVGKLVWLTLTRSPNRSVLLSQLQSSLLSLSIRFYFTSALRRDVDGGLKIAQDALCEGLGINDNRIIETHLYKHVDRTNPRIEVCLATTQKSENRLLDTR